MRRVSVIIPVFNRMDLVSETIESVLAQTYRDFEIVLINDGSTDNTIGVLSKYQADNVRIINQKNQGQGIARNTGINASKGELIAFLDSDDLWLPKKLEKQVKLIDSDSRLGWCYSDAMCFSNNTNNDLHSFSYRNRPYEGLVSGQLIMKCFIPTLTVVARRCVLKDIGLFCDLPKAQDWDLWLRISAKYPVRRVPEVLARYRLHSGNLSGLQPIGLQHQCHVRIIERAIAFAPEVFAPFHKRALANRALEAGQGYLLRGATDEARRMFVEALHHHPRSYSPYLWWLLTLGRGALVSKAFEINRIIHRRSYT